jgi:hypothetical protein
MTRRSSNGWSTTPKLGTSRRVGSTSVSFAHPPARSETYIGPLDYNAPQTVGEARAALLALGEQLAKSEISVEAHDALVGGLRAYLGDKAADPQRKLDELEEALRGGERP